MRLKPILLIIGISSAALNQWTSAQSLPPTAQLDQMIAAGQYQQAYALASGSLEEWEGDTEFDFLFGIAALESGFANESVFAFERVMSSAENPTLQQRARLELARAHLLTNNLIASESLFNAVLLSNPPQNVRENIEAFLTLIESRRENQRATFSWSIAPTYGHDDNINSATANGLIDTPLIGEIELNPDGLKTGDNYADINAGMSYKKPLTRDRSVDASVTANRHDNRSSTQFDMDYVLGDISFGHGNQNNRFRHSLQIQKIYLDSEGFQSTLRLNNSWQHAGANGWYQSLSASFASNRLNNTAASPSNDLRDSNQILVSGGITKLSRAFTNSLTVFYADDKVLQSAGEHNSRDYYGIAHSVSWRLNNQHSPYLRVSIQETTHASEHPVFFNDVRNDNTATGALGWNWQYNRRLSVNSEVMYTRTDSNIPLFAHTRFRYQAGFRFQM